MSAKNLGALGVLATDRRDHYVSPQVTKELWSDSAPFTTIVSNRNIVTGLADPVYKMFEHASAFIKQQFTINAFTSACPNNDTGIAGVTIDGIVGLASAIDSSYVGLQVEVWDTTLTTRKGVAVVTAMEAATSLTMKSLKAAAFTFADNDVCYVIGNAQEEGVVSPEAWADELKVIWNSTQIFKTPVEITGTLYEAALRGYSNELARLRMEKNKEHKMQIERALLFGTSVMGTNLGGSGTMTETLRTGGNSKSIRTTYGIISAIEDYGSSTETDDDQSIFSRATATYTYNDFVDDMEKVFYYLPEADSKIALCGGGALSYWSKLQGAGGAGIAGKSKWTVNMSDMKRDALGFNYKILETPRGMLKLVFAPGFRGIRNDHMVILSDENLSLMQYRPSKFQANIKTDNAYDGVKDQWISDLGLGITLIQSHKLFKFV